MTKKSLTIVFAGVLLILGGSLQALFDRINRPNPQPDNRSGCFYLGRETHHVKLSRETRELVAKECDVDIEDVQ